MAVVGTPAFHRFLGRGRTRFRAPRPCPRGVPPWGPPCLLLAKVRVMGTPRTGARLLAGWF